LATASIVAVCQAAVNDLAVQIVIGALLATLPLPLPQHERSPCDQGDRRAAGARRRRRRRAAPEAVAFAERIGHELAARPPGSGPPLSTSAGVAALSSDAPDPAALMLVADRALYAAKAAGRRRVAVWEDGATRIAAHIRGGRGQDEPELAAHAL
jgi:hypothetical protein